jgi:ArsR family transcriptional regulator
MTEPVALETTHEDELKELSRYFYALKEVWRLRMLEALAGADEITVSELAERLNISQPLLSWHLRRLRQADIVQVRKEGRESFYALDRQKLAEYQAQFNRLLQP